MGLSFEEVNTTLAIFHDAGRQGSDAGISLRRVIDRLNPRSAKGTRSLTQAWGVGIRRAGVSFGDSFR